MKPAELFGVVVRSLGLLILSAMWILFWVAVASALEGQNPFLRALVFGGPVLFFGIWLFGVGGTALVNIAYPEEGDKKEP
jgi:hypothetical protein